jgi:four helix bundle protein
VGSYVYRGANTQTFQTLPGYKKIVAWQAASDLTALVGDLAAKFGPGHYRLANQMRGAAISIAANIAEGYASGSLPNYLRYCNHARGSLAELGSYLQDCEREGLATGDALTRLLRQYSVTTYLLDRLIQALIQKELTGTWDNQHQVKETAVSYVAEQRLLIETDAAPVDDTVLYADLGSIEDLTDYPDLTSP